MKQWAAPFSRVLGQFYHVRGGGGYKKETEKKHGPRSFQCELPKFDSNVCAEWGLTTDKQRDFASLGAELTVQATGHPINLGH